MTDPTDPAAIASRLTPRQRKALMWLPADGSSMRSLDFPVMANPSSLKWIRVENAIYTNLVEDRVRPGLYCLTPIGQRVRAAVEAGQ